MKQFCNSKVYRETRYSITSGLQWPPGDNPQNFTIAKLQGNQHTGSLSSDILFFNNTHHTNRGGSLSQETGMLHGGQCKVYYHKPYKASPSALCFTGPLQCQLIILSSQVKFKHEGMLRMKDDDLIVKEKVSSMSFKAGKY